MPLYEVEIEEVRHYTVIYTVEADDPKEAEHLALDGNTVEEEEVKFHGVMDRHSHGEPVLVEGD